MLEHGRTACYPELEGFGGIPCTPKDSVAGTKNTALTERNRRICLLRRNGYTYGEIATMEQISRPRVAQIVAETMPELDEDTGRAELAGILEFVERKAVGLVNEPGPLMGPNGKASEDQDGQPIPNNGIVVEGLKILTLVTEKKARLYGWDKQQTQRRMADEEAKQQAAASLAALAAAVAERNASLEERHRRELEAARLAVPPPVIAGEVVRSERQRGDGS